uniref:Uncharacterized protein n=1 Tax=Molossus molossus TaxID=27622 RepID=A0A7J8BJN1_MOLMO|nr:hypothetical protein HJG59_010226 [Molossus molossus]
MMINEAQAASGTRRRRRRPRGARRAGRTACSPLPAPWEGRGRTGQRRRSKTEGSQHWPPQHPAARSWADVRPERGAKAQTWLPRRRRSPSRSTPSPNASVPRSAPAPTPRASNLLTLVNNK